ncbi:AfsR/SARP family transcriptional regulator [Streptacidiphilus sp. 4-A2]|nr:AfsR/SARP family transcriptional regulator [Streptacidiphilus sp. 4-A2]
MTAGYRLEVREGELDLQVFTDLCGSGRRAEADQQWSAARSDLAAALGLWRGEPLADVDRPALDQAQRQHLEELRLQALQGRIHADLQLGLHTAVLPELLALTRQHPLTETFHGLLMLALYRSNRPGDALTAYQHARTALAEALGADPGHALQQLHQDILRQSPALSAPPDTVTGAALTPGPGRAATAARTASPTPHQLPSGTPFFVGGRRSCGSWTHWRPPPTAPPPRSPRSLFSPALPLPRIALICGTAAAGKTVLAVHWARRAADRFPDGQLYVDLRGFDPSSRALAPSQVLCGFLDALGVSPAQRPVGAQAQAALYRSLLADRRMLVVLDNACDEGQVRPLLPGGSGCAVVVTSRAGLTGLAVGEGARLVPLGRLGATESRELLARRSAGSGWRPSPVRCVS